MKYSQNLILSKNTVKRCPDRRVWGSIVYLSVGKKKKKKHVRNESYGVMGGTTRLFARKLTEKEEI